MRPSTMLTIIKEAEEAGLPVTRNLGRVKVEGEKAPLLFWQGGDVYRADIDADLARNLTPKEARELLGLPPR